MKDFITLKIKLAYGGLGIGDWGLGDWGLGIGPNPQSPIPNPHIVFLNKLKIKIIILFNKKIIILTL